MRLFAMAPKRMRLIIILIAFLIGITLGGLISVPNLILLSISIVMLGISLLVGSRYIYQVAFLGVGLFCLGWLIAGSTLGSRTLTGNYQYTGPAEVISVAYNTPPNETVVAQMHDGPNHGRFVRLYTFDFPYNTGQVFNLTATIAPAKYTSDLARSVIGSSNNAKIGDLVAPSGPLAKLRTRMIEVFGATVPEPNASLGIGLLTGVSQQFDKSFKTDLQRTGTTHIVAVSGYNLTILALFLMRLGQRKSRLFGFGLAVASLIGYVILAGFAASILRGAIVGFLSLMATVTGRVTHRTILVLLAASLLSIVTPLGMLYDLSWQLSFLAFVAILYVAPPLKNLFATFSPLVASLASETIAAELLTLPLIAFRFGIISLVAPLVNGFVLMFVPWAMAMSAIQVIVSLISIPAGRVLAWLTYPILDLVVRPIQTASQWSWAATNVGTIPTIIFICAYCVSIGLIVLLLGRKEKDENEVAVV